MLLRGLHPAFARGNFFFFSVLQYIFFTIIKYSIETKSKYNWNQFLIDQLVNRKQIYSYFLFEYIYIYKNKYIYSIDECHIASYSLIRFAVSLCRSSFIQIHKIQQQNTYKTAQNTNKSYDNTTSLMSRKYLLIHQWSNQLISHYWHCLLSDIYFILVW